MNRYLLEGTAVGALGGLLIGFDTSVIAGATHQLTQAAGAYPFVFFAAMLALQFVVVFFAYPETKGVSLERLQQQLGIE